MLIHCRRALPSSATYLALGLAALCGPGGTAVPPACAQPQTGPGLEGRLQQEDAAQQALETFARMREENGELEVRDPLRAIGIYQKFFETTAYLYPQAGIAVSSTIARMYWLDLNQQANASEIYEWAVERYKGDPRAQRLLDDRDQLAAGMKQLKPAALPQGKPAAIGPALRRLEFPATISTDIPAAHENASGAPGDTPGYGKITLPQIDTSGKRNVSVDRVGVPAEVKTGGDKAEERDALAIQRGQATRVALRGSVPAKVSLRNKSSRSDKMADVEPTLMHVAFLIGQIDAGRITTQEALKQKLLTVPEMLEGLQAGGSPATLTQLSKILLRRADDETTMAQLLQAPVPARLRIARAWAFDERSPRCVPLYQSVMYVNDDGKIGAAARPGAPQAVKQKRSSHYTRACQSLGEYYEIIHQPQLALEMFEQVLKYELGRGGLGGNAAVGAARAYKQLGHPEKAKEMYARVPAYAYGWATGVALCDQVTALMSAGKLDEARVLAETPFSGVFADQIRIALNVCLAQGYYKNGDFANARKYSGMAVQLARKGPLLRGEELEGYVVAAESLLRWSQEWLSRKLYTDADSSTVTLAPFETTGQNVVHRFTIRSFRPAALTASSDTPGLLLTVSPLIQQNDLYSEYELEVQVPPNSIKQNTAAHLLVKTSELPAASVGLTLGIRVKSAIQTYPSQLFLGFVQAGIPITRKISLVAAAPFVIREIKTGQETIKSAYQPLTDSRKQEIVLTFTPDSTKASFEGSISIVTDLPHQEVITIPYFARLGSANSP